MAIAFLFFVGGEDDERRYELGVKSEITDELVLLDGLVMIWQTSSEVD